MNTEFFDNFLLSLFSPANAEAIADMVARDMRQSAITVPAGNSQVKPGFTFGRKIF